MHSGLTGHGTEVAWPADYTDRREEKVDVQLTVRRQKPIRSNGYFLPIRRIVFLGGRNPLYDFLSL